MYAGRIVETAPIRDLFNNPQHPYTVALMASLPKMEDELETLYSIEGQPPNLSQLKPGCSFMPRCDRAMDVCSKEYPTITEIKDGHSVSCWLTDK
jgi:oligopeptide/dipeptide ABC transporter ATP-binding protein